MAIYDISLPLQPSLACWPGDTPFDFALTAKRGEGSSVNVGKVTLSVHAATHIDAPFHFAEAGATVDKLDLHPYIGPAIVIDVEGTESIGRKHLEGYDLSQTPRILLRTNAWKDTACFPTRIQVMAEPLPSFLKEKGVVLIGLDVPSVDSRDSTDLPIHHALTACGIRILESVVLRDVPPGVYELIALPLKIVGADGAPVRAILRT